MTKKILSRSHANREAEDTADNRTNNNNNTRRRSSSRKAVAEMKMTKKRRRSSRLLASSTLTRKVSFMKLLTPRENRMLDMVKEEVTMVDPEEAEEEATTEVEDSTNLEAELLTM